VIWGENPENLGSKNAKERSHREGDPFLLKGNIPLNTNNDNSRRPPIILGCARVGELNIARNVRDLLVDTKTERDGQEGGEDVNGQDVSGGVESHQGRKLPLIPCTESEGQSRQENECARDQREAKKTK